METRKIIIELIKKILEEPKETVQIIAKVPSDFFLNGDSLNKIKKAIGIWNLFLNRCIHISTIDAKALNIFGFVLNVRADLIPKIAKLWFIERVEENVILSIPPEEELKELGILYAHESQNKVDTSDPNWWIKYYGFDKLQKDEKFDGGKDVKLGYCDTGIHRRYSDESCLGIRVKAMKDFTGYPTMGRDGNGHGNSCALLMASSKEKKLGVAPKAWVYSAKVLDDNGRGRVSSIINGTEWLVNLKVHGIGYSLGANEHVPILCDAIAAARRKGIFICVAAGNSGKWPGEAICEGSIHSPGDAKGIMVVGVLGKKTPDQVQTWSSRPNPEQKDMNLVMINGVGIDVCDPRLKDRSGTSFACPKITPLGASMVARLGITNYEAVKAICDTARPLGYKDQYGLEEGTCLEGHGAVQAYEAWKKAKGEIPEPKPEPEPELKTKDIVVKEVPDSDDEFEDLGELASEWDSSGYVKTEAQRNALRDYFLAATIFLLKTPYGDTIVYFDFVDVGEKGGIISRIDLSWRLIKYTKIV